MTRSAVPMADAPSDNHQNDSSAGGHDVEVPRKFIPTPERLSQYLEMNIQEVASALKSVEGRQTIYQKLMEHEQDLLVIDPTFNPDLLREQLDLAGEVLREKERFLQDVQSPEKKGIFKRAWEKMKGFAGRHPLVMTLLVLALSVGGVALVHQLLSSVELAQTGLNADVVKKFLEGTDIVNRPIGPMPDFNPYQGLPKGL